MSEIIGKMVAGLILVAIFVGLVLGAWWLIWLLWTWALPQIWPTGPDLIVRPGYWAFAGLWVLLSLIGRVIFGHKE